MSPVNPSWITETVRGIGQAAVAESQPGYLPIMADALEDAGCDDAQLLTDLRTEAGAADLLRNLNSRTGYNTIATAAAKKKAREDKFVAAHRDTAVALGKSYHARIADLYASKRADVAYGKGGDEIVDWDAYGKKGYRNPNTGKKQPAKYRQGGARLVGADRRYGRVVLENHRGKEQARLPLPPADAKLTNHRGLIGGDLYLIERRIGSVVFAERFGPTFEGRANARIATGYTRTGVALRCDVPPECREQGRELWNVFGTEKPTYWEHGRTIAVCRAEYARKLALAQKGIAEAQASDRLQRAARLVAALCLRMLVTVDDGRSVGYCAAGIAGFQGRYGLGDSATVAQLRATGDSNVERPIAAAALRVAAARFGAQAEAV